MFSDFLSPPDDKSIFQRNKEQVLVIQIQSLLPAPPPLPYFKPYPNVFSCHPIFYFPITENLLKRCTCVALDDATFNNVILLLLGGGGLEINTVCDFLVIFFSGTKKQSTPLSAVLIKPNTL